MCIRDRIAGDIVIEIVDHQFVLLDLFFGVFIGLKKGIHRQLKVGSGDIRHPLYLFDPVSYTHLDVYKRQIHPFLFYRLIVVREGEKVKKSGTAG